MAPKWEVGALAAIVITEHYENHNRVVRLVDPMDFSDNSKGWAVEDGKMFKGYKPGTHRGIPWDEREFTESLLLAIHQWKLRLIEDGDDVIIRDGIEYLVEH